MVRPSLRDVLVVGLGGGHLSIDITDDRGRGVGRHWLHPRRQIGG